MDVESFELKEREPWKRDVKPFFTVGLLWRLALLTFIFAATFFLEPFVFDSPSGFITGGIVALPAIPATEAATSSISVAGVLTLLVIIAVIPSLIVGYRRKKRQETKLWQQKKPVHHRKDFAARLEQINQELAAVRAGEPPVQNVILQAPKGPVPRKGVRLRKDTPLVLTASEEKLEWDRRLAQVEQELKKYSNTTPRQVQKVSAVRSKNVDVTETLSQGLNHSFWLLKNAVVKK